MFLTFLFAYGLQNILGKVKHWKLKHNIWGVKILIFLFLNNVTGLSWGIISMANNIMQLKQDHIIWDQ